MIARMRIAPLVLSLVLAVAAGCATTTAPAPRATAAPLSGQPMIVTELFLGTRIGLHDLVPDAAWASFLDEIVTPAFPDGLTVFDATGRYRMTDSKAIITEPTHVLLIVHDGGSTANAGIERISAAWKRQFRQEAVLRIDARAGVTF
jgi:hypothetical protein